MTHMEHRHRHRKAGATLVDDDQTTGGDNATDQPPVDADPDRSLWRHYRNARLWRKSIPWSLRYAFQARSRH